MLIVSYLPSLLSPRLGDAIRDIGGEHLPAQTWPEVRNAIAQRHVGVSVLDPYADRSARAAEVARLLRDYPSIPIIAYTQFVPAALRALALLARFGVYDTILFQFDDARTRLARLLVRASTHTLVGHALIALRAETGLLTPRLADAVEDLFRRPYAYTSARDLVITSRTPLTTLYRSLAYAGLASPKRLFVAARLLHAAAYLRDPGYTVQQVSERTGYRNPRVLTQHARAVFGSRPSELRDAAEDTLIQCLLSWARRPAETAAEIRATIADNSSSGSPILNELTEDAYT
jgi:AraC-like DNA-binding protein